MCSQNRLLLLEYQGNQEIVGSAITMNGGNYAYEMKPNSEIISRSSLDLY